MTDMTNQIAVHIGDPVRSADDQEIGVVKAVDARNMTVERGTLLGSAYLIPVSTVSAQSGGTLLRVADAGHGVPEAAREQVFERFVQLGAEEKSTRAGRGLGLTFCKLAVDAHGGRIWVEDADPGAAFCLLLPGDGDA